MLAPLCPVQHIIGDRQCTAKGGAILPHRAVTWVVILEQLPVWWWGLALEMEEKSKSEEAEEASKKARRQSPPLPQASYGPDFVLVYTNLMSLI